VPVDLRLLPAKPLLRGKNKRANGLRQYLPESTGYSR